MRWKFTLKGTEFVIAFDQAESKGTVTPSVTFFFMRKRSPQKRESCRTRCGCSEVANDQIVHH